MANNKKTKSQIATTRCLNATSHVALSPVVLCTFYIIVYRRLQTNLNLQNNITGMQRKHAFPGMFFIINERLRSPLYGSMFCAAPILSPRPAPSFPPSPSLDLSIKDHDWARMAGSQSSAMKVRPHSLSVPPPFHAPLPPEVFPSHLLCGLSVPPLLPRCPCTVCVFPLWKSHLWSVSVQRRVNVVKHGCHDATRLGSQNFRGKGLVSLINKYDLVLTGLCICPLSGWWINMSRVGAGTAWG